MEWEAKHRYANHATHTVSHTELPLFVNIHLSSSNAHKTHRHSHHFHALHPVWPRYLTSTSERARTTKSHKRTRTKALKRAWHTRMHIAGQSRLDIREREKCRRQEHLRLVVRWTVRVPVPRMATTCVQRKSPGEEESHWGQQVQF